MQDFIGELIKTNRAVFFLKGPVVKHVTINVHAWKNNPYGIAESRVKKDYTTLCTLLT